jgi:pimeloyl-ACP methyl ester carboxylesterase
MQVESLARTSYVECGPHRLAVDVSGRAGDPAVLLVHGIPGWRGTWREVAARLCGRGQVFVPDLAGFGESSTAPRGFHAADHAGVLIDLLRALGRPRVHLVGFDFGGPTAVLMAARAPALVASLTLAAANLLTDTPIPLPLLLVRPPIVGDLFARMFFGRCGLSLMWRGAVVRRDRFGFRDYRDALRFPQGIAATRDIFQASLRDLPGLYGPVESALAKIGVPCAVVWGERDPFFPVAVGERTAKCIPRATFTVLKGCGHFLPKEDPDGVARLVQAMYDQAGLT